MNVFIGGAWPYANGSLHIGHIAGLLQGDIIARYHRLKGNQVCYVSGSDCHGTPIQIRAKKEGVTPKDIAKRYHQEFKECFKQLGFSYDRYDATIDEEHKIFVQDYIKQLHDKGHLYEKGVEQAYCDNCVQFLPDRFVEGDCPHCKQKARGDQCDHCGSLLEPIELENRSCSICGEAPIFKETKHLYLALSQFQALLNQYVELHEDWRTNAYNQSKRYLNEGLVDRAITRDLDWGIDVGLSGYEDKKIYVWVEAVLGYLSSCKRFVEDNQLDLDYFNQEGLHYYIHGKDNIPFHTIILPALLKAYGHTHLPDEIISSEYVTLEGRKISTSQN